MTSEELLQFIKNHQWDVSITDEEKKNHVSIRRFIHQHLARATKIVAHIVDGLHRVTALNCALLGYRTSETTDATPIQKYLDDCPHENYRVRMITYVPTKVDEEFRDKMFAKSTEIQLQLSKQLPHTLCEILHDEILNLHKKCCFMDLPDLWDCLDIIYRVLANNITVVDDADVACLKRGTHPHCKDGVEFFQQLDAMAGKVPAKSEIDYFIGTYVKCWVKNTAEIILQVVKESTHSLFQDMHPNNDDDKYVDFSTRLLFQKIQKKGREYSIFPCQYTNMRQLYFLNLNKDKSNLKRAIIKGGREDNNFSGVFKPNRFGRDGHCDVTFISCQILLWSRTSISARKQLTGLFSHFPFSGCLQTGRGKGNDAFQWITNFFYNVNDLVYFSYVAWKAAYFVRNSRVKSAIQNNPDEAIFLCLLGSTI
jgi:hypothetical protein